MPSHCLNPTLLKVEVKYVVTELLELLEHIGTIKNTAFHSEQQLLTLTCEMIVKVPTANTYWA